MSCHLAERLVIKQDVFETLNAECGGGALCSTVSNMQRCIASDDGGSIFSSLGQQLGHITGHFSTVAFIWQPCGVATFCAFLKWDFPPQLNWHAKAESCPVMSCVYSKAISPDMSPFSFTFSGIPELAEKANLSFKRCNAIHKVRA